jgi:hypothetical protein
VGNDAVPDATGAARRGSSPSTGRKKNRLRGEILKYIGNKIGYPICKIFSFYSTRL